MDLAEDKATTAAARPSRDESTGEPSRPLESALLGAFVLVTALARAWVILRFPDPDGDAKGHLSIATALLSDPFNVGVHWVWPPGFHYFLAGLLAVGFTPQGVRILDCLLAALLPIVLWGYARRVMPAGASNAARKVPLFAGLLCAVMPIVNLLGTSAQQGTLFTLLVLASVWALDAGVFVVAGVMLAGATMVRYEALGAVCLIAGVRFLGFFPAVVRRLPPTLARVAGFPFVVFVPALLAMFGWMLAHRIAEGTWLGFLRELYRFTHEQRQEYDGGSWRALLWFPVMQPYYLFGLTLPLFLLGIRRAWRAGFIVPLGIYLFLLASYSMKGVLGNGRYYEPLAPIVCLAAAHGASVVGEKWRPALVLAFATAFAHVVWLLLMTGRWTFLAS
jgi:hypothetical protein